MQKLPGTIIFLFCVALHAQTTNSFEISPRQRSYWSSNPHIPKLEDARGHLIATNAQLRGVLGRRVTFKLNDQMKSFDVEELSPASLSFIEITPDQAAAWQKDIDDKKNLARKNSATLSARIAAANAQKSREAAERARTEEAARREMKERNEKPVQPVYIAPTPPRPTMSVRNKR